MLQKVFISRLSKCAHYRWGCEGEQLISSNKLLYECCQASRKVCAAVRSGVRIAEATAGNGNPGLQILTGKLSKKPKCCDFNVYVVQIS